MRISRNKAAAVTVALLAMLFTACGSHSGWMATGERPAEPGVANGELCEPGPSPSAGSDFTLGDQRSEAMVLHLTGFDETTAREDVYPTYDDAPNFGGVWGNGAGGWVVAVLDCDQVDADLIAQMAGGPQALRLINVSHTFGQVDGFRDQLMAEMDDLGVEGDFPIDSTSTGRRIRVVVEDLSSVPNDFGSDVPRHLFFVVEGELFRDDMSPTISNN